MDDRNALVGWTQAQWNRVDEAVLRAWRRVRVAGSFLPAYGGIPRSTQVVPSEVFDAKGRIDTQSTSSLLEISIPVSLSRQQVLEEDLSGALLQFTRAATQVAQLEDWYVFNGTFPSYQLLKRLDLSDGEAAALGLGPDEVKEVTGAYPKKTRVGLPNPATSSAATSPTGADVPPWKPSSAFLKSLGGEFPLSGVPHSVAGVRTQTLGLRARDPGVLGLIEGAAASGDPAYETWPPPHSVLDNNGLFSAIVNAMQDLESEGYVSPYVCAFGRGPFDTAHSPLQSSSVVLPRDRLEPLLGRELVSASAINVVPSALTERPERKDQWARRGVVLSLTGGAVDLAVAAEATPEFRRIDANGRYVFVVFERFALRIKDPKAIQPLHFKPA
jgi:hypothetical protein